MVGKEFFLNRSYCELVITSQMVEPHIISQELGILSSRQQVKREEFSSKHSGTKGRRFQNLWAIRSEEVISEEEDISPHITFFKSILDSQIHTLKSYKSDDRFVVTFQIWIESENGGIGIELSEAETYFLNQISSSIRFTLLARCPTI